MWNEIIASSECSVLSRRNVVSNRVEDGGVSWSWDVV